MIEESDSLFLHSFKQTDVTEKLDLSCIGIKLGDYLIVSSTSRLNVAAGRVQSVQSDVIVMALERYI